MTIGIILAFIATILWWLSGTFQKKVANKFKNHLWLVYQYLLVSFFAILWGFIISYINGITMFPSLNIGNILIIIAAGIIWYLGIYLLWKWYRHINVWIAIIVANLYVFLLYFANTYLFGTTENLYLFQIVIAVWFFVIISLFLIQKEGKKKFKINKYILYPIGTSICWATYFLTNTYFVKENILTPFQSLYFTETSLFIVSLIVYLIIYRFNIKPLLGTKIKNLWPYLISSTSLVWGLLLLYYAYKHSPANIVNVIMVFQIVTASIFGFFILKDKMSKRNLNLMIIAAILLILFSLSEKILEIIS